VVACHTVTGACSQSLPCERLIRTGGADSPGRRRAARSEAHAGEVSKRPPWLNGQQKTRRRHGAPGMRGRTEQHDSRPHTPEDFETADRPGFLTPGFLLAAPSHHTDSGKRAAFVPVTVAGAVPVSHRLPSTYQRARSLPRSRGRSQWRHFQATGARGTERLGQPEHPRLGPTGGVLMHADEAGKAPPRSGTNRARWRRSCAARSSPRRRRAAR
jgi:hypothetical protein